ncbi:MAG: NAD(P)H-dependent oxidoreductase [Cocleimonas sp.]
MNILIVTAHPLNDSLCKLLSKHVSDRLKDEGHTVIIEDLYTQDFNPVLTIIERKSYYSNSYDLSGVSEQARRLKEADALVLLFPTWWFGFPAILKGWFDRVWGPGVAYNHASDLGAIKPLLDNLQNVLVITTLGSPWWVDRLVLRQPLKRIVKVALLATCAKNSKLKFISLYNSEKLNPNKISSFKDKIDKALINWK